MHIVRKEHRMDIISTIKEKYSGLTRKQKQIADFMLDHIERMSFLTLRELSKETGITPMTILNTCTALGYSSFNEMKYESRKYLSLQEKVEVQRFNEYSSTYIPSYWGDESQGGRRKYYRLTEIGHENMRLAFESWSRVDEIIENLEANKKDESNK